MHNNKMLNKEQILIAQKILTQKIDISYVFADSILFNNEVRTKHVGAILHLTCDALIKYMASFSDRLHQNINDLIQAFEDCFEAIEQVADETERTRKFEILLSYINKFTVLSEKDEIELLEKEVIEAIDSVETENKIHEALKDGAYKKTA